ncbi:MAG: endonuclease/exonuclease/phosphatase family protein [Nannocystaceae bacterium]|nr:endonuclease/exonuclease/phosphatase family protein [Nannocystaceae bacterium]
MINRVVASLLLLMAVAACRPTSVPTSAPSPTSVQLVDDAGPTTTIRVGSWNIRRLGHAKTDLAAVASVLATFDIVAIQEVMTREVVEELEARLPDHRILLTDTPRPATGSYREYYGFVYRQAAFDPVMNTFYPDPDDAFVRDPFIACFDGGAVVGRLCLLTVHIVWGDRVAERKAEILQIDDALRWGQRAELKAQWIVLGDFNRPFDDGDRDDEPEEEWAELVAPGEPDASMIFVGPEMPTTIGASGYANAYDHCFVSGQLRKHVRTARRFDLVAEVCDGSFQRCRASVSDHAPYFVELSFP